MFNWHEQLILTTFEVYYNVLEGLSGVNDSEIVPTVPPHE